MGIFGKREPETVKQITDRVLRKYSTQGRPPDESGTHSLVNPDLIREIAKEIKKAKKRGLLIESPPDEGNPSN